MAMGTVVGARKSSFSVESRGIIGWHEKTKANSPRGT